MELSVEWLLYSYHTYTIMGGEQGMGVKIHHIMIYRYTVIKIYVEIQKNL